MTELELLGRIYISLRAVELCALLIAATPVIRWLIRKLNKMKGT